MTLRLYDTARGAVVPFEPPPVVRMYVCGITPYDATHLGHAATYITYDVLQRRLRDLGHETRCVRNITDVDDDILAAARRRGVHYLDLAFAQTVRFDDDMAALNTLPPASEPRATSAIPDIRGFVHKALQRGLAYRAGGSVYFDTAAFDGFGSLSGFGREHMVQLARQWRDDPDDPAKRDPLDFVLWQRARPGEPSWESRWGPGRPGWHVECSTLALRELGETIDLHGGGADLLFPHHECERAQSEAVTGKPFARHWLHQALVHYRGAKMSKSRGNLVFVHELRRDHEAAAIRLALMSQHYRTPWPWHEGLLTEAEHRLATWRSAEAADGSGGERVESRQQDRRPWRSAEAVGGSEGGVLQQVRDRLDDDLDVAGALAAMDAAARRGLSVRAGADLLGIAL